MHYLSAIGYDSQYPNRGYNFQELKLAFSLCIIRNFNSAESVACTIPSLVHLLDIRDPCLFFHPTCYVYLGEAAMEGLSLTLKAASFGEPIDSFID